MSRENEQQKQAIESTVPTNSPQSSGTATTVSAATTEGGKPGFFTPASAAAAPTASASASASAAAAASAPVDVDGGNLNKNRKLSETYGYVIDEWTRRAQIIGAEDLGTVYQGREKHHGGRYVAIKVIKLHNEYGAIDSFILACYFGQGTQLGPAESILKSIFKSNIFLSLTAEEGRSYLYGAEDVHLSF